jgi:hypothetical protein
MGPALTERLEVDMATRGPQRSLQRYWIAVLILILIAWIIYAAMRGPSTPGPAAVQDSGAAPTVRP